VLSIPPNRDPSDLARGFGELISALMNRLAIAVPAAFVNGVMWFVAGRRLKRQDVERLG
jgi:hypothetical protein